MVRSLSDRQPTFDYRLEDLARNVGALRREVRALDLAVTWGEVGGVLSAQADLQAALDSKQAAGSYAAVSHTHVIGDVTNLQTNLDAKASKNQVEEMIAGFIASPADKSYTIVLKMAHGGTITEATTKSASGTCTATFKVNTTALGGEANSVSSSEQSQPHASANTFVAGDDIVLAISSNAACVDMSFSVKYTRTLS